MQMLINSVFHTGVQKNCKVEIFDPCGDICIILNTCLIQGTVMWFWLEIFHVGKKKLTVISVQFTPVIPALFSLFPDNQKPLFFSYYQSLLSSGGCVSSQYNGRSGNYSEIWPSPWITPYPIFRHICINFVKFLIA